MFTKKSSLNLLFIVGPTRSGSSILRKCVERSPKVSKLEFEPHLFYQSVVLSFNKRFENDKNLQDIISQFESNVSDDNRLYGAKIALNFGFDSLKWTRIHKRYPNAKFIFIVRNDIYAMEKSFSKKIAKSIDIGYSKSAYQSLVESLYTSFNLFIKDNPGQGLMLKYESLVSNPREELNRIWEFIDSEVPEKVEDLIRRA